MEIDCKHIHTFYIKITSENNKYGYDAKLWGPAQQIKGL